MVSDAASRYQNDQQTLPETLLQGAGKGVFGAANDVIGEGLKSAVNYTPDLIKQPIVAAGNALMQTDVGQDAAELVKSGVNAYSQFAQNNPRAAADVESVGNFANLVGGAKPLALGAEATGNVLAKSGDALVNLGEAQANNAKNSFVKDLVSPKITPAVASDQFSRSTEQGLFRNAVVAPTPQEKEIIDTVSQLPVSKNKSLLANYNIISDANQDEATNLISTLKQKDVAIPDDTIVNGLSDIRKNLSASPYITGDGEKAADKVINIALNQLTNNPQTASGLLQARKDFDAEIIRLKGVKTFDPNLDSPVTTAVQQVRQGINNMIDQAVPDAGVKASLRMQSNLYRAMDNLEQKGGSEGKNLFTRFAQKAASTIPVKGAIAKTAVALGATGAAAVAPALTAGALGVYGAGKALNSAFLKKAVGKTVATTGRMMGGK